MDHLALTGRVRLRLAHAADRKGRHKQATRESRAHKRRGRNKGKT